MQKYITALKMDCLENANEMICFLRKMPIIGKHIQEDYSDRNNSKKKYIIMSSIGIFLFGIIKIFAYVSLFMYLPKLIFAANMKVGEDGFSIENCFVYFSIILSCMAGSILHSKIFDVNEKSVMKLRFMKLEPKVFFRVNFIYRGFTELLGFFLVFMVYGLHPIKAIYLSFVICFSRYIGEVINILFHKMTGKSLIDVRVAPVIVMVLALFSAYFIPFFRGHVPAANNIVFDSFWGMIILLLETCFTLFMWNTTRYDKIVKRLYNLNELLNSREVSTEEYWLNDDGKKRGRVNQYSAHLQMYELFLMRNKRMHIGSNLLKAGILTILFIVGVGAVHTGAKAAISSVINNMLPATAFLTFCLCDSTRYCKALYKNCDRFILKNSLSSDEIASLYAYSLKKILLMNGIPVLVFAMEFLLLGYFAMSPAQMSIVYEVCGCIVLFGLFYTVFSVLTYYLLQPYNIYAEQVKFGYTIINALMYVLSYAIFFVRMDSMKFMFIVGLVASVMLGMSLLIVRFLGKKTFFIKN